MRSETTPTILAVSGKWYDHVSPRNQWIRSLLARTMMWLQGSSTSFSLRTVCQNAVDKAQLLAWNAVTTSHNHLLCLGAILHNSGLPAILLSVTSILNESLASNTFPTEWKIVKVISISSQKVTMRSQIIIALSHCCWLFPSTRAISGGEWATTWVNDINLMSTQLNLCLLACLSKGK